MKSICVDSGFLIALYDERDRYHSRAQVYSRQYLTVPQNILLIPWPILYETVSTRMCQNKKKLEMLKRDWEALERQGRIELLDDSPFREQAIAECYEEVKRGLNHYRGLSLADRVIRHVLSEVNIRIDLFITFDPGDFSDICERFQRTMI